ncbi:YcjX family protein [Roseovarius sp. SCSIO 43702]|uniref:YcjX family protein n=1 Tax=Roseovarius sp. SCSIO 43702 TaxID=2823043 RepID=UPI001C72CF98|nr:YcjX family protein [Roseovarius sp. SCSIO 43702]QYX57365.1 YcjX family protein [Roseovarius sp. SCSIO 43702]
MVITTLADNITRGFENIGDTVSETFFEPVIRLGVTGLSRAGKTVFITSLVANLMDRGRMPALLAASEGRISAAFLQPQPDDTVSRFDYETHLAALTSPDPRWPDSTRAISELRLSLRVRPSGLLSGLTGPRTVHLDIVDYPGEWLLDLGLMDKDYAEWSRMVMTSLERREEASAFLEGARGADPDAAWEEPQIKALAERYTETLHAGRDAGLSGLTPGRFLLPGDMAGSPALTFAPLPPAARPARRGLWREMERRFNAYKREIVTPFFRDHFSRIDRQIVLVDALGAIHAGPRAVADLQTTMTDVLAAFRPGTNALLSRLFLGRRVEKILFAATKADHLHHTQHPRLTAIMEALIREARDRADFAGAETAGMSIASLRATVEETREHQGRTLDCVRGTLLETGQQAALYPGELPETPQTLLGAAQTGRESWLDAEYEIMKFAPARLGLKPGEGPPHIRLDRAAQFLLGDRL